MFFYNHFIVVSVTAHSLLVHVIVMGYKFIYLVKFIQNVRFHLFRYELPQPSAGRMNDVSAWTECVENSQSQLEHQSLR